MSKGASPVRNRPFVAVFFCRFQVLLLSFCAFIHQVHYVLYAPLHLKHSCAWLLINILPNQSQNTEPPPLPKKDKKGHRKNHRIGHQAVRLYPITKQKTQITILSHCSINLSNAIHNHHITDKIYTAIKQVTHILLKVVINCLVSWNIQRFTS